ncbi:SP_1767 family glycosyltransferase [Terrisporobacter muris]|uniref:SP_1767 family glycosyltransferase n=1 Tax=Terrisporobacter muris TaxID=2963284 RepID=A0A9X2MBG3_9FIRM|nr:SP_1767 family glycosyltransferase [Terrisporobacter muris]MCR1823329.1 SP_1767 family glycosyltransferase [Terrisporobacter muris]
MIKIEEKHMCSGCHACDNICPKKAISMDIDEEGFWYPNVDKNKCVNCNLCKDICPIINDKNFVSMKKAYGCYNLDEDIRLKSSSGGVFSALASSVIAKNGVVFGARFDENFNVVHDYIETIEELSVFRGSKYVQSNIGENFKIAKKFLKSGRLVLFSGTPCQIGGLKAYLRKEYDNLITVDLICHGVPSPMIWQKYIEELSNGKKLTDMTFRDKSKGWKNGVLKYTFNDGSEITEKYGESLYIKGFIKNCYLRPSCYACHFKTLDRCSDLTLGDFWGVEDSLPNIDKDSGVSLIMGHSDKGYKALEDIKEQIYSEEVDIDKSIVFNTCAIESVKNSKRKDFFKIMESNSLEESIDKTIVNEAVKVSLFSKLKSKGKRVLVYIYNHLYDIYIELSYRRYEILNIFTNKIDIMTIEESIDYIIENKCSLSRFGDGEMKLISRERIDFQQYDQRLSNKLKELLQSDEDNHIVGIPDVFKSLNKYQNEAKFYWKRHIWKYGHSWFGLINKKKKYLNSFISRCYMIFNKKDNSKKYFDKIKEIWSNRDIIIIEGEESRLGIGNDLFDNTKSIKRILAPKRDAFDVYDEVLKYVDNNIEKNKLILLALGPTATVMAYDLAKLGYQAIDIGHIDIEYEWFLQKTKSKIAIKTKFVGEAKDGQNVENIEDVKYFEEIMARILE